MVDHLPIEEDDDAIRKDIRAGDDPDLAAKGDSADEQFSQLASQSDVGLWREFVQFMSEEKKWWLTPILISVVVLSIFGFLASSPVAPFIYSLF